jgi:hypothetical protein
MWMMRNIKLCKKKLNNILEDEKPFPIYFMQNSHVKMAIPVVESNIQRRIKTAEN